MADMIPIISQAKSLLQFLCGDSDGARETQINFSKRCPIVSQARSLVEVITDGSEAARQTQLEFLQTTVNGVVDSTPVWGHAKGIVHYILGDKEGGDNAMKAASRTIGTIAGSTAGFLVGGPPGAIAGGTFAGSAMDIITTGVDSAIHYEYKPTGIFKEVTDIINNPTDVGKWIDTSFLIIGDGATGYIVGKELLMAQKASELRKFKSQKNAMAKEIGINATNDLMEAADRMEITRKKYDVPENKPHITSIIRDKKTGKIFEGHNEQVRKYSRSAKAHKNQMSIKNAEVMSDYSVDKSVATRLERKLPGVQPPLKRQPRACAEHRAYHKFYREFPNADPKRTRVSTVRHLKSGKISAVERCQNCLAFGEAMGEVPGDSVNNRIVPRHPGLRKHTELNQTVKGVLGAFSIPPLQDEKVSYRHNLRFPKAV